MAKVLLAQERWVRHKGRAKRRLEVAQDLHAEQVAAAEKIEVEAWADLFTVSGMNVPTAAAMLQVSEASVAGWATRVGRSVVSDEGRDACEARSGSRPFASPIHRRGGGRGPGDL